MDRLSALEAFVRLADLGTFSAVADELRIRQSTVSKWIASLEDDLGIQLVERTTRSLRITDEGETFLHDAREVLAAYEHATGRIGLVAPKLKGRLRISVPVVFGRLFVVPELGSFMSHHPDIHVELVFSDRYVNLLEENVDLAIRVGIPKDSTYRSHVLGEHARSLVAAPRYLETHNPIGRPEDLANHQCLTHTGLAQGDIWTFERGRARRPVAVHGRFAANNSDAIAAMVEAGHGVALLADWLVGEAVEDGRLVRVLEDWSAPRAPIRGLTGPTRFPQPRVAAFIEHLRAQLARRFR